MSLESDLFKRLRPNYTKLINYGFKNKKSIYEYHSSLMNGSFDACITVDKNGEVEGKVIDIELDEEYVLVHTKTRNEYAAQVRGDYLELLEDIAKKCFYPVLCSSNQANTLIEYVQKTYGDEPDNPFKKIDACVIRNHESKKWYGLIMEIPRGTLDHNDDETKVEILNIKVKEENVSKYLEKEDVYPAYHMKKKNWISIVLDGKIKDSDIKKWIDESYQYTILRKTNLAEHDWLIPANPKYYDVLGEFKKHKELTWKPRKKVKEKDSIYIYYAAPYSCIVMKCIVKKVDAEGYATLRAIEYYKKDQYPLKELKENGCNTVRFMTRLPLSLKKYIESK